MSNLNAAKDQMPMIAVTGPVDRIPGNQMPVRMVLVNVDGDQLEAVPVGFTEYASTKIAEYQTQLTALENRINALESA